MNDDLNAIRHRLHSQAELSEHESATAALIGDYLKQQSPDKLIIGLGGHGLAAIYEGKKPGPRILIRCELDGLPITETTALDYASKNRGAAHKCGHDGHMTILLGLSRLFKKVRPANGSVVLLFQPSEENGRGAGRVIDDPQFREITPDYVFALHNLPGFERHQIIVREGVFASASKGLIIKLHGATSHAAEPQKGRSPAPAAAALIQNLSSAVQYHTALEAAAKVTIIHARVGEIAFGTSPGEGEVMATLRAHDEEVMEKLSKQCAALAEHIAGTYELKYELQWVEPFPSTVNDGNCVELIIECADELALDVHKPATPFPWSEDFGHFTALCPGAMFGLGSGLNHPALHHPDYDFPDDLIETGVKMFKDIIDKLIDGYDCQK
jgi:amidohydrolase